MDIKGGGDDATISQLIPAASELIGRFCSRPNLGKIYTYQESYFPNSKNVNWGNTEWKLVLRHYPVTTLTSVLISNSPVPILTANDLQVAAQGVYLEEDEEPRVLRFRGTCLFSPSAVQVNYAAGYDIAAVPAGLQQATAQFVAEIMRSSKFINLRSVAIAGETTSYDMGTSWGMSNRVQSMLAPYRNVAVFQGR